MSDIETIAMPVAAVEGEARIYDIDLGQRLGFAEPVDIRKLIRRHEQTLGALGVVATMALPPGGAGGRPGKAFYLNKSQAVFITAKSDTDRASEITVEVIQRFDEYERGHRVPLSIPRPPAPLPPRAVFKDYLGIAKMCGFTGNQATLAANRATISLTGFDPMKLMGVTHLLADEQEELLTATAIGERLDGASAKAINLRLACLGLQERRPDGKKGVWVPTAAGERLGRWLDTNKKRGDGTPVRQWKWLTSVISQLDRGSKEAPSC